jgi:flavodoxin
MKALIVYESFFGNTEKVAFAVREALATAGDVRAVRVADVTPADLGGIDLLVVGTPTRGFSAGPATKAWIKTLTAGSLRGKKVAAFDTRIDPADVKSRILPPLVKLFGYAAEPLAQQLRKLGGSDAAPPAGFYVQDSEGPLKAGEIERAAAWARGMV